MCYPEIPQNSTIFEKYYKGQRPTTRRLFLLDYSLILAMHFFFTHHTGNTVVSIFVQSMDTIIWIVTIKSKSWELNIRMM